MKQVNTKLSITLRKGFTLIELMIVIGIIGILAVIAIPQYNRYIARAQVTEGINMLGGAKAVVAEYKSSNGTFPTTQAQLNDIYPIASSPTTSTKYIATITPSTTIDNFVLTVTFKSSNVSSLLVGKTINYTTPLTGEGTAWICWADTMRDVLPASCR